MLALGVALVLHAATPVAKAFEHLMSDEGIGNFKVNDAPGGSVYLTHPAGLTVYTYKMDQPGWATCVAACADAWPPVLALPGDLGLAPFLIITRDDGRRQIAYWGMPLYRNALDREPGQTNGEGVDGEWSLVPMRAGAHGM